MTRSSMNEKKLMSQEWSPGCSNVHYIDIFDVGIHAVVQFLAAFYRCADRRSADVWLHLIFLIVYLFL